MFLQGFSIDFPPSISEWGRIGMNPLGTSLTFASPFLFFSLLARWEKRYLFTAWFSILAALVVTLFYHNNGAGQYNAQRFSLDYLPVLIILVARGGRRVPEPLWKGLIGYSIGLNFLAFCVLPVLSAAIHYYFTVIVPL